MDRELWFCHAEMPAIRWATHKTGAGVRRCGLSEVRTEMSGHERISREAQPEGPGEVGRKQARRGRWPWCLAEAGEKDRAGTREASRTGPVCLCSPDHVHWRPIPLPIWGQLRMAVSQGAREGYGSSEGDQSAKVLTCPYRGVQGWSKEQRGLTAWKRVCLVSGSARLTELQDERQQGVGADRNMHREASGKASWRKRLPRSVCRACKSRKGGESVSRKWNTFPLKW